MDTTMAVLLRLPLLTGCLFAGIYSLVTLIKKHLPGYYKVALVGVFAIFLSRLYFFILTITNGDDFVFSVGVFGQVSSYLFFIAANLTFLPEREKRIKFTWPALIVALIPTLVFAYIAVMVRTFDGILCEVLYIICFGAAAFISMCVIAERKVNRYSASVVWFNRMVCAMVYANVLNELLIYFYPPGAYWYLLILGFLSGGIIASLMPLLKKGVDTWKA